MSRFTKLVRRTRHTIEGRRDAARLATLCPELAALGETAARSHEVLAPAWREYVTHVSTPNMAISLALSGVLDAVCRLAHPARIVDLGSGFSSWVLRRWATEAGEGAEVWSVDDSDEWLGRTRATLRSHGLGDEGVVTWESFLARAPGSFDLVLHDLGRMLKRRETLSCVLGLVTPRGHVVLDDVDDKRYGPFARRLTRSSGFEFVSLRRWTLDEFGRFSAIVVPRGRLGGSPR